MKNFDTFHKIAKNVGNLGKIIVSTGVEKLPKCNKSPNLVTLIKGSLFDETYSVVCIGKVLPFSSYWSRPTDYLL